jgi:hypothetical protein
MVVMMMPILHLLQVLADAGGCADHGAIGRCR